MELEELGKVQLAVEAAESVEQEEEHQQCENIRKPCSLGRCYLDCYRPWPTLTPKCGPVYVAKYDLSDGFYWLQLSLDSILPLAALLPTPPGEDPLVALPLVVTMGWTKAPPSFCTTTKTATNLENWSLSREEELEPHCLEQ